MQQFPTPFGVLVDHHNTLGLALDTSGPTLLLKNERNLKYRFILDVQNKSLWTQSEADK